MPPSESNARGPHAHNAGRPSNGRDGTRRRQGGARGSEKRASDERAYSLPAAVYSFCRMYCRFMTAAPGITADFHCVLYCVNNRSGFRKTRCGVVKIYHIHLSSV